jgi:hypothetical protein
MTKLEQLHFWIEEAKESKQFWKIPSLQSQIDSEVFRELDLYNEYRESKDLGLIAFNVEQVQDVFKEKPRRFSFKENPKLTKLKYNYKFKNYDE